MKRTICMLLAVLMLMALLTGCGARTVHCDRCGKEIAVQGKSNIQEDWIVFCKECELEAFGEEGLIQ